MYGITILCMFFVFAIDEAFTDCPEVKVEGVTVHPQIDGEYELYGRCGHLEGSLIYQKKSQETTEKPVYLYYYEGDNWKGWIFSNVSCSSLALVRLSSNSSGSPEIKDSDQIWEELDGVTYTANQDISINCITESDFTTGIIILLSLLCAVVVLLIAMAPLFWILHKQQRKPTQINQPSQQPQRQENIELSVIPEPPPYTPAIISNNSTSPIATINLPPYTSDNTITRDNQPALQLAQPPAYEEKIDVPPPSYDCSINQ